MEDYKDWCLFANFDFEGARLIYGQRQLPSLVVFHCHAALEKALKALWVKHSNAIVKTHDLRRLLKDVATVESWVLEFIDGITYVHDFLDQVKYPTGDLCTQDDAMQCMVITESFFKKFNP